MIDTIVDLVRAHPVLTVGVGVGSFVVSIVGTALALVRIPADYFAGDEPKTLVRVDSVVLRLLLRIGRNLLGVVLVALGIVMSFPGVPGQGILTLLIGVMLLDLPRKRRLERWIVSRERVRRGIDKLRARFGRGPLVLDDGGATDGAAA